MRTSERSQRQVALVTCRAVADLDEDDQPLVPALASRGITAVPAVWDDPNVDWDRFDLTVLRSTWDYSRRAEQFLQWAQTVPRLMNPEPVVAWNIDKAYLRDLAASGVPTIATTMVPPGDRAPVISGDVVVKPSVSAGSRDTARLTSDIEVADLVAHIHSSGRTAMVQPYVDGVDYAGETALVFIDARFSHAARKGPLLSRGAGLVADLYAQESTSSRVASGDELAVAHAALAAVPTDRPLLYARIDLLPGADGPVVLEVEVIEPSLFLGIGGAIDSFADAITRQAAMSARGTPPSRS